MLNFGGVIMSENLTVLAVWAKIDLFAYQAPDCFEVCVGKSPNGDELWTFSSPCSLFGAWFVFAKGFSNQKNSKMVNSIRITCFLFQEIQIGELTYIFLKKSIWNFYRQHGHVQKKLMDSQETPFPRYVRHWLFTSWVKWKSHVFFFSGRKDPQWPRFQLRIRWKT